MVSRMREDTRYKLAAGLRLQDRGRHYDRIAAKFGISVACEQLHAAADRAAVIGTTDEHCFIWMA
jgi:hypothetical protein